MDQVHSVVTDELKNPGQDEEGEMNDSKCHMENLFPNGILLLKNTTRLQDVTSWDLGEYVHRPE